MHFIHKYRYDIQSDSCLLLLKAQYLWPKYNINPAPQCLPSLGHAFIIVYNWPMQRLRLQHRLEPTQANSWRVLGSSLSMWKPKRTGVEVSIQTFYPYLSRRAPFTFISSVAAKTDVKTPNKFKRLYGWKRKKGISVISARSEKEIEDHYQQWELPIIKHFHKSLQTLQFCLCNFMYLF